MEHALDLMVPASKNLKVLRGALWAPPPPPRGGPSGPPSDFSDFWLQSHPLLTPHPLTVTGHQRSYWWAKI